MTTYWKSSLRGLETVYYLAELNVEIPQCALFCLTGKTNHSIIWDAWTYLGGQEERAPRRYRAWEWPSGAPKGSVPLCVNQSHNQEYGSCKQPWSLFQTTQRTDQKTEPGQWKRRARLSSSSAQWDGACGGAAGASPRAVGLHPSGHGGLPAWASECGGLYEDTVDAHFAVVTNTFWSQFRAWASWLKTKPVFMFSIFPNKMCKTIIKNSLSANAVQSP